MNKKTRHEKDVSFLVSALTDHDDYFVSPYQNTLLPAYIYHNKAKSSRTLYPLLVRIQRLRDHRPSSFFLQCECLDDALFYRNFIFDQLDIPWPDEEGPSYHYQPPVRPDELLAGRIPQKIADPRAFIISLDDLHPPYPV